MSLSLLMTTIPVILQGTPQKYFRFQAGLNLRHGRPPLKLIYFQVASDEALRKPSLKGESHRDPTLGSCRCMNGEEDSQGGPSKNTSCVGPGQDFSLLFLTWKFHLAPCISPAGRRCRRGSSLHQGPPPSAGSPSLPLRGYASCIGYWEDTGLGNRVT